MTNYHICWKTQTLDKNIIESDQRISLGDHYFYSLDLRGIPPLTFDSILRARQRLIWLLLH